MFSRNPNRSNGALLRTNSNAALAATQPTPQQLNDMLRQANQRIADLENRLREIERAIYVGPSGDVEICSATQVRIIAGVKVEIQADHSVEIAGNQRLQLKDQNGNSIQLGTTGISNSAAAQFQVSSSTAHMSAGSMTVDTGMARYSGVVRCDTIIANSVVGSSYTPGAGNLA